MKDYVDHVHSGHLLDFHEFLEDKDITWELFPLKNVTDTSKVSRTERERSVKMMMAVLHADLL